MCRLNYKKILSVYSLFIEIIFICLFSNYVRIYVYGLHINDIQFVLYKKHILLQRCNKIQSRIHGVLVRNHATAFDDLTSNR